MVRRLGRDPRRLVRSFVLFICRIREILLLFDFSIFG